MLLVLRLQEHNQLLGKQNYCHFWVAGWSHEVSAGDHVAGQWYGRKWGAEQWLLATTAPSMRSSAARTRYTKDYRPKS